MISKKIIDTDLFLDMPATTRLLYYDLLVRADDDGFVGSPKKITKLVGASDDDLRILISKQFIIPFDSGVCVIKDWKIHNYIRTDRKHETQYIDEKSMLTTTKSGSYAICQANDIPSGNQLTDNCPAEVRLGKDRLELGKDRVKDKEGVGEETPDEPATASIYEQVRESFIANCPSLPKPNATTTWTPARKKAVREKKISADEFATVFKRVEQSDFLTGRKSGWHGCSFDWILKPANWQKISEGNYDNKGGDPNARQTSNYAGDHGSCAGNSAAKVPKYGTVL